MPAQNTGSGDIPVDQNRRTFFKTAIGASALPVGLAQAGSARHPVSWVHGNSATVVGAFDLEMDVMQGNARVVRGRSWSSVPLHFAVPLPGLDRGEPARVSAIWIRLQSGAGAAIRAIALHDCECTLARIEGLQLGQSEWGDVRIPLQPARAVTRSIGITLDCEFADVERQIGISAVGCEFQTA